MRPNYVFRAPAHYVAPQFYRPRRLKRNTPSFYDPATEQQVTIGTLSVLSPLYGNTPAVTTGDYWILPLVTSPGGYAITAETDGTFSYDAGGDQSRQSISMKAYDVSESGYFETEEAGDYFTVYVNNAAPVELSVIPGQTWYTNIPIAPIVLGDRVSDADDQDETLTYQVTTPGGLEVALVTYNPGTPGARTVWQIQGTPVTVGAASISVSVEDPPGATLNLTPFAYSIIAGIQIPSGLETQPYTVVEAILEALGLNVTVGLVVSDMPVGTVTAISPTYPTYVIPGTTISLSVAGIEDPDGEVVIPPPVLTRRSYWRAKRQRYEQVV